MLLTKRAHHCTIFQTFSALMKVHPITQLVVGGGGEGGWNSRGCWKRNENLIIGRVGIIKEVKSYGKLNNTKQN